MMKKYICTTLSGRKLAECEAENWYDALDQFTKMGYSIYKCDIIRVPEDK